MPVRVGLIVYGGLEPVSGGHLYDRQLVEHLIARGDQVDVIALSWRDYLSSFADNFSSAILSDVSSRDLDVLLEDELAHSSLLWLNRRIRSRGRFPIVGIVHHLRSSEARQRWQNALYRSLEFHYLQTLDGLIYNSQTTRSVVERLLSSSRPSVVAYPAGDRLGTDLSPELIQQRAYAGGPLQICFAGNVIPRKGLDTLIAGLALMKSDDWTLAIAGSLTLDPSYVAQIRRQMVDTGIAARVRLLGPLDASALANLFSQSQVLAVPSTYEGFGIVYIEAMAFGVVAIASTAGAACEVIDHGKTGLLVHPGDAQSIAAYLGALQDDRDYLASLGKAARARYSRHPTWQQSMERVRSYLERVVEEG